MTPISIGSTFTPFFSSHVMALLSPVVSPSRYGSESRKNKFPADGVMMMLFVPLAVVTV